MLKTIFFGFICVLCIISIILDVGMFISWSKAKEKAFVANWLSFLITVFLFAVNLIPGEIDRISIALDILMLLVLPCEFTCLSPEGIRTMIFRNKGLNPVENLSYEYKKGRFFENLCIYQNNVKSGSKDLPMRFNIGIKRPKTVKMLADWYGKHGYENPLIK